MSGGGRVSQGAGVSVWGRVSVGVRGECHGAGVSVGGQE